MGCSCRRNTKKNTTNNRPAVAPRVVQQRNLNVNNNPANNSDKRRIARLQREAVRRSLGR